MLVRNKQRTSFIAQLFVFFAIFGYWKQTSNPNQIAHNVWHHVAFTKSTSGTVYYLDGNLINSQTYTDPAKTPATDIIIGDSAVDTDIDNLRIYNRALSFSEVLQNGQS